MKECCGQEKSRPQSSPGCWLRRFRKNRGGLNPSRDQLLEDRRGRNIAARGAHGCTVLVSASCGDELLLP